MQEIQKLVARIDQDHWLLLSQGFGSGEWTFLIWGTYPLTGTIVAIDEAEAKKSALSAAQVHLQKQGLKMRIADSAGPSWQVAVRYIAA